MSGKNLKILAHDQEDLDVLSTFMQDAIIPLGGMDFDQKQGVFKMAASRYRWDLKLETIEVDQRIHTGLSFHGVDHVAFKGFSRSEDPNHSLDLLTIQFEHPHIYLVFAGEAKIRLTVKDIHVRLKDAEEAWPAMHQPEHEKAFKKIN